MSGCLGMVIYMIAINDKSFFGYISIPSEPDKLALQRVIDNGAE
jgi:hypothetical protein